MRISEEMYQRLVNKQVYLPKESKYKNKKVIYDGIEFDSQKEGNYYLKYKTMQDLGIIKDLKIQPVYELQPSFKLNGKTYKKITYRADFSYVSVEDNKIHIIDVKGFKTDIYKLKKKLMAYKYKLEIEEV